MEVPRTAYATCTDGVHVAFQIVGDGPPDLVFVPNAISHIARCVLPEGGTLAILWNTPRHDPAVQAAFDNIYERFRLPDGSQCSAPGALAEGSDRFIAGVNMAGGYSRPIEVARSWTQRYSADEWIDLLPTHSDHRLLSAEDLEGLLDATRATITKRFQGRIHVTYTTRLITAQAA